MPEQNVSIKNRTTSGVPQCTAGSAYGSYGVVTVYMETRLDSRTRSEASTSPRTKTSPFLALDLVLARARDAP